MPSLPRPLFVLSLGLFTTACGTASDEDEDEDDGPEPTQVECEWIGSADDCWTAAPEPAAACLTPIDEPGVFDEPWVSCSWSTGSLVADPPLPDGLDAPPMARTITMSDTSGDTCLVIETTEQSQALSTADGEARVDFAGSDYVFTCPDGNAYAMDLQTLLSCEDIEIPSIWTSWASSGTPGGELFTMGLGGYGTLFACEVVPEE